jgi:hypothetical protein
MSIFSAYLIASSTISTSFGRRECVQWHESFTRQADAFLDAAGEDAPY